MINGQFFKDAFSDKELSMRRVASLLGMKHHSQLSLMLSGSRRMQLDEAIALSKLLSIPLNTVIANAGFPEVMQEGRRLPVVGVLRGGGEVDPLPELTERAVAPPGLAAVALAIQARTTDTPLSWMDRWVFYCTDKIDPSESPDGEFCYAQVKGGPAVMATVRRGYAPNSYRLSGPYETESAELEWVAPVASIRT